MSTNKHATIRYQALDRCFRNPARKYYIEDLVQACNKSIYEFTGIERGISKRQIFEDIKFMESSQGWYIDLERSRDGHKIYYRYLDKSFSINNQLLNESDENQLKEALLTLSRIKGLPQFEWIDEITARLDSGLHLSHANKKIIGFDQNNYLKGLEFFTPLYNAILYEKVISLKYKSFKQEAIQDFILHSYFLKQYHNRWYVFGKNDTSDLITNLALDRIVFIKDSNKKYKANNEINFDEYFEDIIGVTLNKNSLLQKIVLKVSSSLYPYIATKPLHGSQKIRKKEKEFIIITLEVIPNYELESLILSYGEGVELIEPQSLRDKIKKRVELILKNY